MYLAYILYVFTFRGEYFFLSLQTDDGRQVMAIAHTGELRKFDAL
jgi:hypothetical protein